MSSPQSFVCINNFPTPYRIDFYNLLADELHRLNIRFEVMFMIARAPEQGWQLSLEDCRFSSRILDGWQGAVFGRRLFWNPSVVRDILQISPRWLLIGGGWFLPSTLLAASAHKLCRGGQTYFWSESHMRSSTHFESKGLVALMRRICLSIYDGYVIPGQWAREYLLRYSPSASEKPLISLPNLVDDTIFATKVDNWRRAAGRQHGGSSQPEQKKVVLVARLEPIKGVKEFLQAAVDQDMADLTISIVGEGSLKTKLQLIASKACRTRICFLGQLDRNAVANALAGADVFALVSLRDAYPLAVLEAMFAALPLLLSKYVGCHPEMLRPGVNGWLVDPNDPSSIVQVLKAIIETPREALREMGTASRMLAFKEFHSNVVIPRFVRQITA